MDSKIASSFCCLSILDLMCVCFELISIHENDAHSCEMVVHLVAAADADATP